MRPLINHNHIIDIMAETLSFDNIVPSIEGKTIALFGDLSKKRNLLIKQFIFDGFGKNEAVCIVTLISTAFDLVEELSSFYQDAGMIVNDAIFNEKLFIIDMYSFRGVKTEEPIPGSYMLNSANDLTMLSIKLNEISKKNKDLRIVIWPYSLLAIYTKSKDLIDFTQTLSARINHRKQKALLIADSGVIGSQERNVIETIVDSVIETAKIEEDGAIKEFFRVKYFKGDENYEFDTWTLIE